jgi:hypothetical protein
MSSSRSKERSIESPPDKGTLSAREYFQVASQNFGLVHLVVNTVATVDYVQSTAKRALDEIDAIGKGKEISGTPPKWGEVGQRRLALKKFDQVLLQASVKNQRFS